MLILNIIILILAAILAVIQLFKDNVFTDNEKAKRILSNILVVGIFLGLGVSLSSELLKHDKEIQDAKIRESEYLSIIGRADTTLNRVDSNLNVSDSILTNSGISIKQLTEIQISSQKLKDSLAKQLKIQIETNEETKTLLSKSKEAISLVNQSINEQTGGNSFCVVDINISPDYSNPNVPLKLDELHWEETIVIRNDSQYSLRNVHIEIQKPYFAFQNSRNHRPNNFWVVPPLKSEYFVGKYSKYIIYEGPLPDSILKNEEIVYNIDFFLGNGNMYTQVFKFRKRRGLWIPATKVLRPSVVERGKKYPLYNYEYIHPLYPQKPVDWNYIRPSINIFRQ